MDDISEEEVQQMDAVRTEHIEDGENAMMMMSRKEKRKAMKKQKRKQLRKEAAVKEREEEEARANDPDEKLKEKLREKEESEIAERVKKEFEERERLWLEAAAAAARRKAEEEENRKKLLEETLQDKEEGKNKCDDGDHEWEYIEDGPAEIIWKDNEIIFKKKRIRVPKRTADCVPKKEVDNRPTSNPLPPQSAALTPFTPSLSAQELLESVAQQTPNFGTEQDKAHCPFHLKTGVCRFGNRCNRTHFYPDKSCTLLIKNMYSGPGLVWEQDEGLEYTDEEIECCFEEFYEDVHTEFLKFGEIVNFKVCRNGSFHLRGNVYVHYKSLESACLAYNSMNGRYFAGKQIICEFIGVTRWKIAICGEYMKSRLKTCSRGTTCNFIHCFRNPGGDYEWADWDNLPPKHWMKKMIALFGHSHDLETPNHMDLENREPQKRTHTSERVHSGSCHAVSEKDESVHHGEHPNISIEQDKLSRKHSSFCREQDHSGDEGYTSIYHSKRRCSSRKTCYIRSGSVDREVDLNEEEKKEGDNSHEGKRYRKHKRDRSYSQTRKEHKHGKDGSSSYYHERYYSHDGSLDCDYDRHYEDVCVVTGLISHPPENALSQTATGDDTTNTSHHGFAECKAKKVASFRSISGDLAGESNKCIKHDLQKHSSYNSDQDVDRRYQKHMVSDQSVSSGESIGYKKDRRNKSKKRTLGDSQSSYNNDWSEVKESVVSSRKSSENHRGRRRKSSCNDDTKRDYQRKKKPKNDEREDGQEDSASSDPGRKNRKRSSRETSMERSGGSKRR